MNLSSRDFIKKFHQHFKDEPPILYQLVIASIALLILSFIWLLFDTRLIHDQLAPLKPIKQLLGTLIFLLTLPWLHRSVRIKHNTHRNSILISAIFIYEIIAIFILAFYGLESHFNNANALFIVIRLLMFFGILYVWYIVFRYLLSLRKILLEKLTLDPITIWAQIYGCILFSLGSITASFMFYPKYNQNIFSPIIGGHSMGDYQNSERIYVGWHKYIGDLRIPHFFGLHCLQYFWLIAFLILAIQWSQAKKLITLHGLFVLSLSIWILLQALALSGISPLNSQEPFAWLVYGLLTIYFYIPLHLIFLRFKK